MALHPFRDKRVLLATIGTILAATVLLATAVSGQNSRLDRSSAASNSSTSSAQDLATTTTGSTPSGSPGSSSNPPPRRAPGLASRVIQWLNEQAPLSGGPAGAEEEAFAAMLDGDCARTLRMTDELSEPGQTLYRGAASACLAAFNGRAELWPRAEAAYEKTRGQTSVLSCESRTVHKLLQRLVDAHRMEPQARLVKRSGGMRTLRCPRFTRVTPDHGPVEGGYTVRLEGEDLPQVVGVNLDVLGGNYDVKHHHVTAVSQDGRHLVITIPPATNPDDQLLLWPDGARFWYPPDSVEFKYDPPAATTRRSTTTSTTKPQPTAPTSTTTVSPSSS